MSSSLLSNRAIAAARLVFAAFAILAFSAAAVAQPQFIAYVSATGNDANPCTAQSAPCRTLQRGVNATPAGGELRLLTPIHGNVVVVKSITIFGNGATIIGVITINNASAVVALRDLTLNGRHAFGTGINILAAAAVHIEDCTVERYTSDGIKLVATTATKLFISDTVASTSSDGLYADAINAQVVIENSGFDQNGSSGVYLEVAKASVTGSSASGNGQHGFILVSGRAKITETTADNNSGDGFIARAGTVVLNSAEAHGNGAAGLHVEAGNTYTIMSDCVFFGAGAAHGVVNQSLLYTRENNTVVGWSGTSPPPQPLDGT